MSASPPRHIPAERSAPPRELEIRPKQVKAWLESMPLAQPVEAARKILAHLAALNRSKIALDDRVQILDGYGATATTILDELDAIYGKAALPLGPRAREALTLARGLAFELASGYKIAIAERPGKLIAFGGKKQLAGLALRAMEYLGAELRASYKSYSSVPAAVWAELHQLYLYAEKEGIAAEPVEPAKATVVDAYCEALLLSLTDPYRLVHGEADRIIAQIRGLRGLATLGQARPATPPGGHFIVPCDTDRPPKPSLSANDDTGGPNWRLLDASALVDKLRARKLAHESGNVSQSLSRAVGPDTLALMGRLVLLWGDPPKRAWRRDAMETSVAICAGLKSIGHFLALESRVDPTAEADAIRAGITIPLISVPDDDISKGMPVHEWDVVNQSQGGIKVRRTADMIQPLAVGEAVGIKFMGRARWAVGAVRWITQLDGGGMEFGVQLLALAARPVWVQPAQSATPQAKPGLVLTEDDGAQALLTLPGTFAELRVFELEAQGEVTAVRATGLIQKTARFDLFHISDN